MVNKGIKVIEINNNRFKFMIVNHKIVVDKGAYFTINRPRQFGKTTTFNELMEELNKEYIVIKTRNIVRIGLT